MSCNKCYDSCKDCKPSKAYPTRTACEESQLNLGISQDGTMIVGSFNGVPISPIRLERAVDTLETVTSIEFDAEENAIAFHDEAGDTTLIPISQILANASIEELSGIDDLSPGGLASVVERNGTLMMTFEVPPILPSSQQAQGFVAYVPNVAPGEPHYKLIAPETGTSNSVMVGRPNGRIEFAPAISSPRNGSEFDNNGRFSGTPAVDTSGVKRSRMGSFPVITNTDASPVEVEFELFMQFADDGPQGAYARLENNGSDYVTQFFEGLNAIDRPLGRGGMAKWTLVLGPGQSASIVFGVWSQGQSVNCVIGNFRGGSPSSVLVPPVAKVRRLM